MWRTEWLIHEWGEGVGSTIPNKGHADAMHADAMLGMMTDTRAT